MLLLLLLFLWQTSERSSHHLSSGIPVQLRDVLKFLLGFIQFWAAEQMFISPPTLRLPDVPVSRGQSPNSDFCPWLKSVPEMSLNFNKSPDCLGFNFFFWIIVILKVNYCPYICLPLVINWVGSNQFPESQPISFKTILTLIVPSANSVSLLKIAVANRLIQVIHKICIVYLFL